MVRNAEAMHDLKFVGAQHALRRRRRRVLELQAQHFFLLATEERQDAVRWQLGEGFAVVKIVGELRARLGLALLHLRHEMALSPECFAQRADEVSIFGEALDKYRAGTFERRCHVGNLLVGVRV